jgi:hypothetical protein
MERRAGTCPCEAGASLRKAGRREPFFETGTHNIYQDLLAGPCAKASVEVWAYAQPDHLSELRRSENTSRLLAAEDFLRDLERRLGRPIAGRGPGRKPKPGEHPTLL